MSYERFAYIYDQLMEDMPYDKWQELILSSWTREGKPSKAVDLGCGTGRLATRIASQGVEMYGIDLSADMLAVAQSRDGGEKVHWLQQDMRSWQLPVQVQLVYSFCDSLNYLLDEQELLQTFWHTCEALDEQGLFMFDMLSSFQYVQYDEQQPHIWNEEDLAYIWTCDYDEERTQIEHDLTFFIQQADGRFTRWREIHQQRAFDPEWVYEALLQAGFHEVLIGSDFSWQKPHAESERFFFQARKW